MQKKNKYMRNNTLPIWIPNTFRKQLFDFMGAGFGRAGRGDAGWWLEGCFWVWTIFIGDTILYIHFLLIQRTSKIIKNRIIIVIQLLKAFRIKFQNFAVHTHKDALINETSIPT